VITPVFNTYLKRVSFCECGNRKLAASHLKNTSDGLVLRLQKQNAPPEVIRQRIGSYFRRWKLWAVSRVRDVTVSDGSN
jgi:hypothetical protein